MYKLSMFQVVAMICTSFLPLMLWIFPRYAAYYAGADGQWAVLGVCIIALFSALLHGILNQRFRKYSGADMPGIVFGQLIGKFITMLFWMGYLVFVALSIYSFSVTLKSLLPNTPRAATGIALALVAIIGAQYGLEALARVASIIFPVTFLVLAGALTFTYFEGTWVGVFMHPVSIARSVRVSAMLLPMFFGFNLYLMLSPYFDHRKRNEIWIPVLSVGISCILIMGIYLVTIRVVGYEGLRVLVHPIEFVLQLVQIRGFVIERFGVVLVFALTMFQTVFFANHLWSLSELLRRVFQLQQSKEKWLVIMNAALIIGLFLFIPNQQVGDWIVLNILFPLSWVYLIGEPIVKIVVSYIRGNVVRSL